MNAPQNWKVSGCCFVRQSADGQWIHELIVCRQDDFASAPMLATVHCRAYADSEKAALKPDPEALAIAHLISAAPDLLTALQLFMEQYYIPGDPYREGRPEIIAALAAIAKATPPTP